MTLLVILLQGRKADWFLEMMQGKIVFTRYAITFAKIIYRTLQSAIGRTCVSLSTTSFLGIRTRFVLLSSAGKALPSSHFLQNLNTPFPIKSQKY